MSNEEKNTRTGFIHAGFRIFAAIFGLAATACVFGAAFVGYDSPLFGAGLLALGVAGALGAFIFGLVFGSAMARRFSYFAVVLAVLITLAGIVALLLDKSFEDRCVEDWNKLSQKTEHLERRINRLEDRFDRD